VGTTGPVRPVVNTIQIKLRWRITGVPGLVADACNPGPLESQPGDVVLGTPPSRPRRSTWWLTPVIPATGIARTVSSGEPGRKVHETPSELTAGCVRGRA
jgi:hypothetical protein